MHRVSRRPRLRRFRIVEAGALAVGVIMQTIEEINAWLKQSLKRGKAGEKADKEFQRTGKTLLPSATEWQQYPCDICATVVGDTGHIELNTAEAGKLKVTHLSVRCHACYDYFSKHPIFPIK